MFRFLGFPLGVLVLALLLLSPVSADPVVVGGQTVMRLPGDKAKVVTKRIDALLQRGADPEKILAKKSENGYGIYWGDVLLLEVTKEIAKENKSTPKGLALVWTRKLYDLVGPGLLQVSRKSLVLPKGRSGVIEISGIAQGPISLEGGSGVVNAEISQERETVTLLAAAVGKTSVVIRRGKGKVRIPVHVKDWAGYAPKSVSIKVTGNPAPGNLVAQASLRAVAGSTRLNPGARLKFPDKMARVPSVPNGQKMRYALPVVITAGSNYFPVKTTVNVQVESTALKIKEPNLLLVSNRPERVEDDGVLLEYTFSEGEPTRLMYSHMNQSSKNRELWVNLYNESSQPVSVWIGETFAGPNRNEVHTGHMAAVRFLRQSGSEAGYVVTIPARKRFVVADHMMSKLDLLSGFANFQIIGQGKLRAEVHSALAPARNNTKRARRLGGPFNPFKIHPHGVFAQPYFEEWVDMTPDSPTTSVPYGKSPWLIDFETGLPNTGNFGVVYRYHFVLTNPSRQAADFELTFIPHSGPGAGTFLVDGDILEAPFRRKGVRTSLGRFRVDAGKDRTIDVVTLPEASSNYPAYLEMRSVR